jgi:hypothetical protein
MVSDRDFLAAQIFKPVFFHLLHMNNQLAAQEHILEITLLLIVICHGWLFLKCPSDGPGLFDIRLIALDQWISFISY